MNTVSKQAQAAFEAKANLANLNNEQKNNILKNISIQLDLAQNDIILANKQDIKLAEQQGLNSALIDRLTITTQTIKAMCKSLDKIINLPDPCNNIIDTIKHSNNMVIKKVSVPIGVIAIIYESRPNVTLDAAALCIKSGNCVILKGGKEAINSNREVFNAIHKGINTSKVDFNIVQFIASADRIDTLELLKQDHYVDIIIPRGGMGLINFINENTNIPVIKHLHGICHTYIDKEADLDMACAIIINAKCQRPGVCNAMETLVIHEQIAEALLTKLLPLFIEQHVELRVCAETKEIINNLSKTIRVNNIVDATENDWTTEYLDLILAIRIVANLDQAIQHINYYGSHHSEAIVTANDNTAELFMNMVDSAVVYHNASTRFTDGEEFGMGAEMGISTDKLHARGPVGLKELTTYKYKIYGNGQIRS